MGNLHSKKLRNFFNSECPFNFMNKSGRMGGGKGFLWIIIIIIIVIVYLYFKGYLKGLLPF